MAVRLQIPLLRGEKAHAPRPRAGVAYRRLLVPLGTGAETAQAVSVGCRLAADRHATLTALYVIEVPQELPLDCHMVDEEAEAARRVADARSICELHGVSMSARITRARAAGEAIVDEALLGGIEAIVIGAPRGRRGGTRAPIFGKTADAVMKQAPCRVVVAALPATPEPAR